MRLTFNVRRKHINTGKTGSTGSCAVALALQDAGCTDVSVDTCNVRVTRGQEKFEARTSNKLSRFIDAFDSTATDDEGLSSSTRASRKAKAKLRADFYRLDFKPVTTNSYF